MCIELGLGVADRTDRTLTTMDTASITRQSSSVAIRNKRKGKKGKGQIKKEREKSGI